MVLGDLKAKMDKIDLNKYRKNKHFYYDQDFPLHPDSSGQILQLSFSVSNNCSSAKITSKLNQNIILSHLFKFKRPNVDQRLATRTLFLKMTYSGVQLIE